MSYLELTAAILGVISVWYSRQNNILVYPTGIISVLLYVYICYMYKVYADAAVNFYYFVVSVIGWINWSLKKDNKYVFPISKCDLKEWLIGILLFGAIESILYFVLVKYTNSDVPVLDSLVASSAAVAMWWMARRKIESWHAWTFSNVLAIPMYYYKGLYYTVGQYIFFLVLAVWGYFTWKKLMETKEAKG